MWSDWNDINPEDPRDDVSGVHFVLHELVQLHRSLLLQQIRFVPIDVEVVLPENVSQNGIRH
jgi:hypothetical protein